MIDEIRKMMEEECKKEANYFGYRAWTHHILNVVKYSKILAKKMKADEEVVEIAALLHDYAGIKDYNKYYSNHHIHGTKFAEEILSKYNYPKDKTEKVKHCIMAHRNSKKVERKTKEAEIVVSADSLAHFGGYTSLLYLAFVVHKKSVDEGTKWVLDKLEKSYNKLIPEAKEIINVKYAAIKKSLK